LDITDITSPFIRFKVPVVGKIKEIKKKLLVSLGRSFLPGLFGWMFYLNGTLML